jgi:hypothetical protein
MHLPAADVFHGSAQQIFEEKSSKIAEVGRIVNRGAASVQPHSFFILWGEIFY